MFAFINVSPTVLRATAIIAVVLLASLAIALTLTGHDLALRADDGYGWGGGSAPADILGSI